MFMRSACYRGRPGRRAGGTRLFIVERTRDILVILRLFALSPKNTLLLPLTVGR